MTMKAKNLGRLELLAWINELIDADYPKIENCSDGIAYCQILDSLYPNQPNAVQLQRLNLLAKNKQDCQRNLKVLQDAIKKLGLPFVMPSLDLLSNGKFQYNMECIQWLFDYSQKVSKGQPPLYNGYYRRQEALLKQLHVKGMYLDLPDP